MITAEEFLMEECDYNSQTGFYGLVEENDLIKFTNLHLDNAIKEWTEHIFNASINKENPMNYIDWLKEYKTKNKLI
jgi:hypothetical protein